MEGAFRSLGSILGRSEETWPHTEPQKLSICSVKSNFVVKSLDQGKDLQTLKSCNLQVVQEMKPPTNKTQVKRILGFFSYFREHIKDFANVAQPLTNLTSKKYSGKIHWGELQQQSFEELKRLLCKATVEPLYIVDFAKPFNLFVDASLHTVSAVLTQTGDDGTELPVAFSSTKLSQAQTAWSTIEREGIW